MTDRFSQIPRGVIVQFALSLDLPEILALCKTSKSFNSLICDNRTYWINRLIKVYGIFIKDIPIGYTPKSYYAYITNKLRSGTINQILMDASRTGDLNLVKISLGEGADPSFNDNDAIRMASANGHPEVVKLLLADNRVDPAANNNNAIKMASLRGHPEVVKLLLANNRVDPGADTNYVIKFASENGRTEVVKLLLADPKVDPAADNNYAIRLASQRGHPEVVRLLLADDKVDPAAENNYAIRWASHNKKTEVVRLLLADPRVAPVAM